MYVELLGGEGPRTNIHTEHAFCACVSTCACAYIYIYIYMFSL